MILLKFISPKNLPRKKSEWKFWHKCYKALLHLLLKMYAPGVINDIISMGDVEVRHTLRDKWFENELNRFGINFSPTLKTRKNFPFGKRKYHRSRLFSWTETLTAERSRQHCSLNRDRRISLDSNIGGTLKTSSDEDDIIAIWIKGDSAHSDATEEAGTKSESPNGTHTPKPTATETPKKNRKVHIKDSVTDDVTTPNPPKPTAPEEKPKDNFTQHQGFEENDIF